MTRLLDLLYVVFSGNFPTHHLRIILLFICQNMHQTRLLVTIIFNQSHNFKDVMSVRLDVCDNIAIPIILFCIGLQGHLHKLRTLGFSQFNGFNHVYDLNPKKLNGSG